MPFRLLQIQGQVEPFMPGPVAKTWEDFEIVIYKFLKVGEYNRHEDGLFFIELDHKGKFKNVGAFTNDFMEDMIEKAKEGPRDWSPRKK